ncbi:hypothetical protein SAMN04489864_103154 [Pedobacter insulae]|uniref:Uncharacterized protein n=2 Tax=Pedobacter insulae TaxID=414048 RepID=A0A1I2VP49_9SPHI|nr:hypothetical protein SAMN04489864_103154 [Pedobacter insulae]
MLLYGIALLVSCGPKKEEKVKPQIFLEQKLSDFITSNPDWTKDEATEKETTEKFKHKLINLSNEAEFLKDMPLQVKEIKDTSINEIRTKIATFKAFGDTSRNAASLLNYMQLQITGIVSEAQANELVVDKKYTITGSLHKQGKRSDVKFIHVSDFRGYDLGKYTFLINGFKSL